MRVTNTDFIGVVMLSPSIFRDNRGQFVNLWNNNLYEEIKFESNCFYWKEDDISVSHHGVLRGIHGDDRTHKLISCLYGQLFVVVLDKFPSSKWLQFTLDDINRKMLFISAGYGLGHQVVSNKAILWYKQSEIYEGADKQFTIHPFSPSLNIPWPLKDIAIMNERDIFSEKI